MTEKSIKVTRRKISDYKDDPQNANLGSKRGNDMLDDSLEQTGIGRSLVADGNDYITAGNKTLAAAKRKGITEVIEIETKGDAIIVHKRSDYDLLSDTDKRARLNAYFDNVVPYHSINFDASQIAADVESGLDLGMMFDPGELALMIGNDAVYGTDTPDTSSSSPEINALHAVKDNLREILREKWGTETEQLWSIPSKHGGRHLIMIGDCREPWHVQKLFGWGNFKRKDEPFKPAQIAITSPPYAEQRKNFEANEYGGIPEDEYVEWFEAVQRNTGQILVDGGSFFVNIKPNSSEGERVLYVFDLVLSMKRDWGWQFIDEHCWQRHSVPGKFKRRLKNGFEPIYEFAKPGEHFVFEPRRMGTASDDVMVAGQEAETMTSTGDYYNIGKETQRDIALPENIFHAFGVRSGIAHSAMYPVAVPYRFMMIYSNKGDIIYDPFLGSGTNIHAAEKSYRLSYGMELLPSHAAVILEEWALDGYEPELVG